MKNKLKPSVFNKNAHNVINKDLKESIISLPEKELGGQKSFTTLVYNTIPRIENSIYIIIILLYYYNLDEFKLTEADFELNKTNSIEKSKKLVFFVVDDEALIRSAIKRVIISELNSSNESLDLTIVEACDGIECLLAMYLYNKKNINIDAIISDETMSYISGSYLSKIIYELVSKGVIPDMNIFISTGLIENNFNCNYSNSVKKVFKKPIDKNDIKEILSLI